MIVLLCPIRSAGPPSRKPSRQNGPNYAWKQWRPRRRSCRRAPWQMQVDADADARAYDALSQHAHAADLVAITRSLMTAAAQVKRVELRPEHTANLAAK